MTTLYRLRWRHDAHGYHGQYAGQWITQPTPDHDYLTRLADSLVYGHQTEIVEHHQ